MMCGRKRNGSDERGLWRPVAAKQCEDGGFVILGIMPAGEGGNLLLASGCAAGKGDLQTVQWRLIASELVTDPR